MKHPLAVLLPVIAVLLVGCGTMNSNFSCNAEAGDSCLTIEQVDAMTRFADDVKPVPPRRGKLRAEDTSHFVGNIIQQNNGQSVWVARNGRAPSWA